MRVGLLGGSFNPPHAAHRAISLFALKRLKLDRVWWLLTPGNPLKDPAVYAAYDDRLRLARAVANHPDIVVSDFERRRGLQYTCDTIDALQALNPHTAFVWLMGADGLENFHRWKNWRHIAQAAPIAVFNRPGHGDEALSSEAAQASRSRLVRYVPQMRARSWVSVRVLVLKSRGQDYTAVPNTPSTRSLGTRPSRRIRAGP